MRTTVTLDPDTESLLREEVRRSKRSFKEVLNLAIRQALGKPSQAAPTLEPLFPAPFPSEFDGQSMNHVADSLDDDDTLKELSR